MTDAAFWMAFAAAMALPAAAVAQTRGAHASAGKAGEQARARKPGLKAPGPPAGGADGAPGRLGGDGWQQGWIAAGGDLKLEQQFLAGQPAAVTVLAAPTAPLAVTVGETGETPVCRSASRACRWQPAYTGRYAITLHNGGAARVRYVLMVR